MMKKIKAIIVLIVIIAMPLLVFTPVTDAQEIDPKLESILAQKEGSWGYVVLLAQDPAVSYEGGIPGFSKTKPGKGKKFNKKNARVKNYRKFLKGKHDAALKATKINLSQKTYDYSVALNGFAARLTALQAKELAKHPEVIRVLPDVIRHKATDNVPDFLELTAHGGPWTKGITGKNVIVGIIDTGIWPEHPSFADDGSYSGLPISSPPCEFGNTGHNSDDAPFTCNNKLLGARQTLATYRAIIGVDPDEFDSARDDDGHGTHTASTAAGNADIEASIFGIPRGTVSGIAPRARVIAYKGLGKLGGFSSDLAAAIDQAVADGADVINYSVGGGASLSGADDLAFLFAADAGVFVATSAGNSGPGSGTIGGPASVPWLTAVGANTQDRAFISEITLDGPGIPPTELWGGSVTEGIENYNLVDAEGIVDVYGDTSGECLSEFPGGVFQPDDVVLCNNFNFGVSRPERVANVAAGGAGAVIFHNSAIVNMTPTDNHILPTVHMLHEVGNPLKAYLTAHSHLGEITVSFTQSEAAFSDEDSRVVPNMMASFSSKGPNPVALDIIKPDVTAPGINILAGASPIHVGAEEQGELFQAIMGTSMSSPVAAGAFALIKQARPAWSPAIAKSALMTTAYQDVLKEDGLSPADPFDMGAGHIQPGGKAKKGSVFEPGLAYDVGFMEYLGFLCDADPAIFTDPEATCAALEASGIPISARDLNLASIGISELPGQQTVHRIVTSVAKEKGWRNYDVSVEVPTGYDVTVTPSRIRLKRGQTAMYSVSITNVSAPIDEWRFGSLTWTDRTGHYTVYSPIAVRADLFNTEDLVEGSGESGTTSFDVLFGYTGAYTAEAHGLEAATVTSDNVLQDPDQNFDPGDGFSNRHDFTLSGSAFFRIALPPDATEANADLDIFVYDPDGNFAASSTKGGTDELIDIKSPMDGIWEVYVHGWSTPGGDSDYDMYSWVISEAPGGNLLIDSAPTVAVLGESATIDLSWTGATAGQWHLGVISHTGDSGLMDFTLVEVDNRH